MNCPYCDLPMALGKLSLSDLRGRGEGVFFVDEDGNETSILERTTTKAFECEDCASLFLAPGDHAVADPVLGGASIVATPNDHSVREAVKNGLPIKKEREKLVVALKRAIDTEGSDRFLVTPLMEPDASFFPDPWTPDPHGVELIAKRILGHAGLGHLSVLVRDEGKPSGEPSDPQDLLTFHPEGCVWLSAVSDDTVVFGAASSRLDDVAGFLSHEVGHLALLLRDESASTESGDEEHRALAFSTMLGLGILTLNHAATPRQQASLLGSVGEQSATLFENNLHPEHVALLLAIQLAVRGTEADDLARMRAHLHELPRSLFDIAFDYAKARKHKLSKALGISA
jgi:hypothetical protein